MLINYIAIFLIVSSLAFSVLFMLFRYEQKDILKLVWLLIHVTFLLMVASFFMLGFDIAKAEESLILMHPSSIVQIAIKITYVRLVMILLTTVCFFVIAAYILTYPKYQKSSIASLLLLSESAIIAAFSSNNLLMFFIAFEISVIPMFLLIGMYGDKNRYYAAFKLFLYTMAGSFCMLVAIILLYIQLQSMNLDIIKGSVHSMERGIRLFIIALLLISFGIKVPIIPFHTWLPDAHVQAPTIGSVLLAAVLLKLGGYGMYEFVIKIFPAQDIAMYSTLMILLSIIAIVYGSYVSFAQTDIKKVIAYSSVAHMGYVTAGLFSGTPLGVNGAIVQMVAHGMVSGAMFMCIGMLYKQTHSYKIADYAGLISSMPKYSGAMVVLVMAAVGLPGTVGFVGEIMVVVSLFYHHYIFGAIASFGAVLGAMYMLSLFRRLAFGEPAGLSVKDINYFEIGLLWSLIILIILGGVYPFGIVSFLNNEISMLFV